MPIPESNPKSLREIRMVCLEKIITGNSTASVSRSRIQIIGNTGMSISFPSIPVQPHVKTTTCNKA